MAISGVTNRGTAVSGTSTSTLTMNALANIVVGRQVIISVVSDNIATTDGNSNTHTSITHPSGNTFTKAYEYTNAPSAAAAVGVTVSTWVCNVTTQINSGTSFTINFSTNVTDKCAGVWECQVASGFRLAKETQVAAEVTGAVNNFGSAALSGLSSTPRLYWAIQGKEANSTSAITATGIFITLSLSLRSRNNASAVLMRGEYKIATSTGETSNPTLAVAGDAANLMVAFVEESLAPTLSSQTVGSITTAGGTPAVTTDTGSGTAYMVVVPDGDSPSVAQIKAGQNSSGAAALAAQNQAVSGTGVQTFSAVTGLSAETAYDVWFVHNANSADSTAVKADFTTLGVGARVFNGSSDYAWSSSAPALGTGDWTIALWTRWGGNEFNCAFEIGTNDSDAHLILNVGNGGAGSRWEAGGAGASIGVGTLAGATTGTTRPISGQWQLVALRYTDSDNTMRLVVDGTQDPGSGASNAAFTMPAVNRLILGMRAGGSGDPSGESKTQYWTGRLAHFAAWTRAVPDAELADMHANLKSPLWYATNLIYYNKFRGVNSPETPTTGSGNLTVSGTSVNGGPILSTPITADAGAYSITGTAATFRLGKTIIAASGSFSFTGTTAALRYARVMPAVGTTFNISGTAANLERNLKIVAASGSYNLTGTAASLERGLRLVAAEGSYLITGTDATLTYNENQSQNYTLVVDSGAFTFTGVDANLLRHLRVQAATTAFNITGTTTPLRYDRELGASPGSFLLTGTTANLEYNRYLAAATAAFSWTGTGATLSVADAPLIAESGAFVITGTPAILRVDRRLVASNGSHTMTGTAANVRAARLLMLSNGAYLITGTDAAFSRDRIINAEGGTLLITAPEAVLYVGDAPEVRAVLTLMFGTD